MNNNDNSYAIDMSNIECGAQRENAYTPETYRAEMEQHQNAILNDLTVHFPSEQQIFQDEALHNSLMYGPFEQQQQQEQEQIDIEEEEETTLMAHIQALESENEQIRDRIQVILHRNKELLEMQQNYDEMNIEEEETTLMARIQALESEKEQIKDMIQVLDHRKKELIELQQNDDYEMDIEEEGEEGEIIEPPVLERQSNGTPPLQPLNLFVDFDLEEEVEDDDDDSISSSSYGSMPSLVTIQEEEDEDEDDQNEQIVFVPTCWIRLSVSIPQNEDGQGTWRLVESSVSDEEEFNRPTKRARQEVL